MAKSVLDALKDALGPLDSPNGTLSRRIERGPLADFINLREGALADRLKDNEARGKGINFVR